MFPNNGTTPPHPFQWELEMNTQEWIHELKESYKFTYNGHREYNNCHLFARKFNPQTLEPLLKFIPIVLGIS